MTTDFAAILRKYDSTTPAAPVRAVPEPEPVVPTWPTLGGDAHFGLAGEFVRIVAPHSEADPVALLLQFLVVAGNRLNRGPHVLVEADEHPAALFVVLVGDSSRARKGTSLSRVLKVFKDADPDWARARILSGLSSGEGLIEAIHDGATPDAGVSTDKRVLVLESEFAGPLRAAKREGSILSVVVRQAWDGRPLHLATRKNARTATDVHLSLIAHVTEHELARELAHVELGNGFSNRLLWALAHRARVLPESTQPDAQALAALAADLRAALAFGRTVGTVTRDEAARALWAEEYGALTAGAPGLLGAMTSRGEAQVTRLALLYALLDQQRQIGEPHLRAALAVWRYCAASVGYLFGDTLADPLAEKVAALLRGTPAGLSTGQLHRALGGHVGKAELARALQALERAGRVRRATVPTDGRPVVIWTLIR